MPSMPYISPAAIGWIVVRLRGEPVSRNRSPIARSIASGQPRPLEELTETVAPSGISAAASAIDTIFDRPVATTYPALPYCQCSFGQVYEGARSTKSSGSSVRAQAMDTGTTWPVLADSATASAVASDQRPSSAVAEGWPAPFTAAMKLRTERV